MNGCVLMIGIFRALKIPLYQACSYPSINLGMGSVESIESPAGIGRFAGFLFPEVTKDLSVLEDLDLGLNIFSFERKVITQARSA